jgi:hypothetical protein
VQLLALRQARQPCLDDFAADSVPVKQVNGKAF